MAVTSHEREAAIKLSRSPAFLLVPLASVENFTCKRKSTAKVRHGQPKVESNKTKKKMASVQTAPRMNSIIIRTFRTPSMLATTWLHTGRSGFMPPSLFTFFQDSRVCGEGLFQPLQMPTFHSDEATWRRESVARHRPYICH